MVLPLLRVPRPPSHWDTAQTHPSKRQRSANFVGTCTCLLKDTLKCFALGKDLRDPLDQLLLQMRKPRPSKIKFRAGGQVGVQTSPLPSTALPCSLKGYTAYRPRIGRSPAPPWERRLWCAQMLCHQLRGPVANCSQNAKLKDGRNAHPTYKLHATSSLNKMSASWFRRTSNMRNQPSPLPCPQNPWKGRIYHWSLTVNSDRAPPAVTHGINGHPCAPGHSDPYISAGRV